MIQQDIKIINRLGIHARPAALIAQTAAGFACDIQLVKDKVSVNAKSIMGVLLLGIKQGESIYVLANGVDEKEALDALEELASKESFED